MDTRFLIGIGIGIFIIIIIAIILISNYLNKLKWNKIEELNKENNITRDNSYIDDNGYLRWRDDDKLCHRDIAYEQIFIPEGMGLNKMFGRMDVHHIDGNKWNNNSRNLEILSRKVHNIKHGKIIVEDGNTYIRLGRISKIYRETNKAIQMAYRWIPKSQCLFRDGYVYITEWIWKKKAFGN